jgi:3',5'-cyclic AMP phosphodiesterase CpdA
MGRFAALSSLLLFTILFPDWQQLPAPPRPQTPPSERVRAITPPAKPLPSEADSRSVTQFSFIAYGDTRGRRDGLDIQYEHSLIVDSMLARIRQLDATPYPVKFVLQSGDAAVNGRDGRQWNVSFVPLINRLTQEGGVPYFLAPGNHDVTSLQTADAPDRQAGVRNFLDAMSALMPPDGSPRRLAGYPVYAFGFGNTFVLALDSNIAGDDRQFAWTKAQLEGLDRHRYVNVIVFFHHPPFSSGPHGGAIVEQATALVRARYLPLFRTHHVRLSFTGHEHLFEHWVERYADAAGPHRLDHVVSGGGGAPLYPYQGEPDLREYMRVNSDSKVALEHLVKPGLERGGSPYHYVIVRVDGDQLDLEVVGVDWGAAFQPYRSNKTPLQDRR